MSERFARVAEIEGFPDVARIFRRLGAAQALHAQGHIDLLLAAGDPLSGSPIGTTPQNLRAAIATHEGELLDGLGERAIAARAEGFPEIASWFETMRHARSAHLQSLRSLLPDAD